jgi:hypothetical protein
MALLGPGETSDLSPLSAPKRTSIDDAHQNSVCKRTGDYGRSAVSISSFANGALDPGLRCLWTAHKSATVCRW